MADRNSAEPHASPAIADIEQSGGIAPCRAVCVAIAEGELSGAAARQASRKQVPVTSIPLPINEKAVGGIHSGRIHRIARILDSSRRLSRMSSKQEVTEIGRA